MVYRKKSTQTQHNDPPMDIMEATKPAPKKPAAKPSAKSAAASRRAATTQEAPPDREVVPEKRVRRATEHADFVPVPDTPESQIKPAPKRQRTRKAGSETVEEPRSAFTNPQTPEEIRNSSPYRPVSAAINETTKNSAALKINSDVPKPTVQTGADKVSSTTNVDDKDDENNLFRYLAVGPYKARSHQPPPSPKGSSEGEEDSYDSFAMDSPVNTDPPSRQSSQQTSVDSANNSPLVEYGPKQLNTDLLEFSASRKGTAQAASDTVTKASNPRRPASSVVAPPVVPNASVSRGQANARDGDPNSPEYYTGVEFPHIGPSTTSLSVAQMAQCRACIRKPFNLEQSSEGFRALDLPMNSPAVVKETLLRVLPEEVVYVHKLKPPPDDPNEALIPGLSLTRPQLIHKVSQHTITRPEGITLPVWMLTTTGLLRSPDNNVNQAALIKGIHDLGVYKPERGVQMAAIISANRCAAWDDPMPTERQREVFGPRFGSNAYRPPRTLDGNNRNHLLLRGGQSDKMVFEPHPDTNVVTQLIVHAVHIVEDNKMSILTEDEQRHYCMNKNGDHERVGQMSAVGYLDHYRRNWNTIKRMDQLFKHYPLGKNFSESYELLIQLNAEAQKLKILKPPRELAPDKEEQRAELEEMIEEAKTLFLNLGLIFSSENFGKFESTWRTYMMLGTSSETIQTINWKSPAAIGNFDWFKECTTDSNVQRRHELINLLVEVLPVALQEKDLTSTKLSAVGILRAEPEVKLAMFRKMVEPYKLGAPPSPILTTEESERLFMQANGRHLLEQWLAEQDLVDCPLKASIIAEVRAGSFDEIMLPVAAKGNLHRKLDKLMDLLISLIEKYPEDDFNDTFMECVSEAGEEALDELGVKRTKKASGNVKSGSPSSDSDRGKEPASPAATDSVLTAPRSTDGFRLFIPDTLISATSDARDFIGSLLLESLCRTVIPASVSTSFSDIEQELATRLASPSPASEYKPGLLPKGIIDLKAKIDAPIRATFLYLGDGPASRFDPTAGGRYFPFSVEMIRRGGFGCFVLPSVGPASYVLNWLLNMLVKASWPSHRELRIQRHHTIAIKTHKKGTEIKNSQRSKPSIDTTYFNARTEVPVSFACQPLISEDGEYFDDVLAIQDQTALLRSSMELFVITLPTVELFYPDAEVQFNTFKYQTVISSQEPEHTAIWGDEQGGGARWLHPHHNLWGTILREIFQQALVEPYSVLDLNPEDYDPWLHARLSSHHINWVPIHDEQMQWHANAIDAMLRKIKLASVPSSELTRGLLRVIVAPHFTADPIRAQPEQTSFTWHDKPLLNQLLFLEAYIKNMDVVRNRQTLCGWTRYPWTVSSQAVLSTFIQNSKSTMEKLAQSIKDQICRKMQQYESECKELQDEETKSKSVPAKEAIPASKDQAALKDQSTSNKRRRLVKPF